MEGWKIGRMEDWKDGRLEGWKDGRMEGWNVGRLNGLKERLRRSRIFIAPSEKIRTAPIGAASHPVTIAAAQEFDHAPNGADSVF